MAGKLGFGFMRLPVFNPEDMTTVDIEQVKKMADYFIENGFTYFDTAYMYHDYTSEAALRQAVVERYKRNAFTVATKMPLALMGSADEQEKIFEKQKENLGVEYIDYYLLHNMTYEKYLLAKKWQTIEFLQEKKAKGEIKHLGFSYHDNAENLEKILSERDCFEFVQLQINYMDWENPGIQAHACYDIVKKHGLKVTVMEPVKGGTLAKIPEDAESLLREVHSDWTPAEWAIKYAASLPEVQTVLSGMNTFEQLKANVDAMKKFTPMCESEYEALRKALEIIKSWYAVPCTACRYCVETNHCPKNIPIPNYFALYNAYKQRTPESMPGGFAIERLYYADYEKDGYGKASQCVKCRKCEKVCPQHLKIADLLTDVAADMEIDMAAAMAALQKKD
ncbi:MAG: aldo/keto reductase [Synergistaceae bacterium]|nr:aldo/keto reductase [Synergistaceae bacterium]